MRTDYVDIEIELVRQCCRDGVPQPALEVHAKIDGLELCLILLETRAGSMFFAIGSNGELCRANVARFVQTSLIEHLESDLERAVQPLLRRSDPALVAIRQSVQQVLSARAESARPGLIAKALSDPDRFNGDYAKELEAARPRECDP